MGTMIKPVFKSDFPRVSEGWHIFRIIEAKVDVIALEDRKEKDGVTNDKNFVVRSVAEGGEDDGIEIQEFFANRSNPKKEFPMGRLLGLMVVTEAIPPMKEDEKIDVDTMRTEKFETKFKMSLPKRLFGGRVEQIKSTQKDSEAVFSNIKQYCYAKEVPQKIAEETSKDKGEGSTKGVKTKGAEKGAEEAGKGKEAPDPWA